MEIDQSSGRRRSVPVRAVFARDMNERKSAPMGKLIAIGGRGGEVLLKLYLALIWRSSAKPFATEVSARKWAQLLALPDPSKNGARRVSDALKTLAEFRLITVEPRRGECPRVTLLREDGSDQPYSVPRGTNGDFYFQIPAQMWTSGTMQQLSAPGLAMLIAVLAEQKYPGGPVWWSTERFPGRYGVSSATRARGTRELQEAGLLAVERKLIPPAPGKTFSVDRVRSTYRVTGAALLEPAVEQSDPAKGKKKQTQPSPSAHALSQDELMVRLRELVQQLDASPSGDAKSK
ncbi:hypothetical protein MELE44368_18825 [Mycolicibacterium elephantis DSM 44368]|uniref:Uncharacterized protein n=1 Tax=Mycolicibacterium elephantis DSM 44368 TaxID=1335622 RepID=A0A439DTV8_9MYCO|nr:hypothetical protein MELE44368_18825 [Mycolicibacterium elephantis DSM 44368]